MSISVKSCRAFTPSLVFPFTFSKVSMMLSHTFFFNVHHVYTMLYLKFTPIWKIKKDWSFLLNVFLCGLFLLMFSKHNGNVFHLVVYFFTIAGSRYNFNLRTSIKCFFHSMIRMISRKKFSMSWIHSFLTVLQLNITRVFFTNGTCKMTFNTVTTQVSIC